MIFLWYVSLSVALWSLLYYFLRKVNSLRSAEWNCRIIAMTHALAASRLVELSFVLEGNPLYMLGEVNTPLQTVILSMSGGYFVFDFAWSVYMGSEGMMMLAHHVVSILALVGGLFLHQSGSEICLTLWGSELTNPFLQCRWFLRETNQYNSYFAAFNDLVFFGIFTCARIGIGTGLAICFYLSEKTVVLMKCGGLFFFAISIIWTWQIGKFVKRRYFSDKGFCVLKEKL